MCVLLVLMELLVCFCWWVLRCEGEGVRWVVFEVGMMIMMWDVVGVLGIGILVLWFLMVFMVFIFVSWLWWFVWGVIVCYFYVVVSGVFFLYCVFGYEFNLYFMVFICVSYGVMVVSWRMCGVIFVVFVFGFFIYWWVFEFFLIMVFWLRGNIIYLFDVL